ncbi:hypothetical protein LCGC14_3117360, partial [marine sediment metagenome]
IDPDTVKGEFEKWWDKQFAAEKGQKFQKFEDRAEFQAGSDAVSIASQIEAALKAGTITQEERDSAQRILVADPTTEQTIREALGL